ncbi:ATP-binding cassette subfamily B protein [Alicyclobacillus sacchari]|uniref:ATP-binding cassette subfamily B protein n=1 Tax=Alicyclobacillus sacchari TaxID=392010 RepID=A0A4R8LSJ3_9BACL|nr:ABC transporter transmembrane domain-containing protein [Alicyclobacillus sacchari]TDY49735.1 ATP-binding cassette subfamily B protein [Alicyclobacillus sacchari]
MFQVLMKLRWFFWQQRKRYAIAVGLLLFLNFVEVAPPDIVGHAIDLMNQRGMTVGRLWNLIGALALVIVISYTCGFTWQYQLYGGARVLELSLRKRLMRHFLNMTPRFFEQNRTGDLMARSTNDLNAVSQTAGFGILTLIDSTTYSATILVTMGSLDGWRLTLLSLIPMPFIALAMTKYGKVLHERFTLAQDAFGDMNDRVLETIAGIRVVRAYAQEEHEEERFAATMADVYRKNIAVARIDALFDPTISMLVGITYLIGLGYGTYLVFQSQLTIGQLTSFNVYLGMLIWPMLAFGQLINIMQRGNASLDRVNETLAYEPDVVDPPTTVEVARPEDIRFEQLTFRYPTSDRDNLQDIELVICRGETLGIVGRTGSGKSTLLRQLLREYPPARAGALTISGVRIEQIAMDVVHGWLGYVPQNPMLFSRSVRDNVRFGRHDASDAEVLEALRLADFVKDIARLPNGLDTLVGERGISLSGGQKQRIALARALLIDPEILILDDAMSAVDARTEAHIIESIRSVRRGRTTLIASHRMSAVAHADWIVVMDDGRIAEEGTFADLMAQGGWYAKQYERQQAYGEDALEDRDAMISTEERG